MPPDTLAGDLGGGLLFAIVLPFTPIGQWFGFVTPPLVLTLALGGVVIVYVICAELLKSFAIRTVSKHRPKRQMA